MNRVRRLLDRLPRPARETLIVACAAVDAWFYLFYWSPEWWRVGCAVLACAVLPARRHHPVLVGLLTLPATAVLNLTVAPFVALYTYADMTRRRTPLAALAVLTAVAGANPWPLPLQPEGDRADTLINLVYALGSTATPVLLGALTQAYRDLEQRLRRIHEIEAQERALHTQSILGHERARLAREMHDVVSHQVSLIAVHAGALKVSTTDRAAGEAAVTIRKLAVTTLDELRTMVAVLRVSGGSRTSTAPQPTVGDLRELVDSAGPGVRLQGELPVGLSTPVQRAVYRTVQEALTNVRKHAPGAPTDILLWCRGSTVGVTVTNEPATAPPLALPGSGLGLIGLRERATALGGSCQSRSVDGGGFHLEVSLPATST